MPLMRRTVYASDATILLDESFGIRNHLGVSYQRGLDLAYHREKAEILTRSEGSVCTNLYRPIHMPLFMPLRKLGAQASN